MLFGHPGRWSESSGQRRVSRPRRTPRRPASGATTPTIAQAVEVMEQRTLLSAATLTSELPVVDLQGQQLASSPILGSSSSETGTSGGGHGPGCSCGACGIPVAPRSALPAPGPVTVAQPSPFPLNQTFQLNSRPGALRTIYLDFNGEIVTGTEWNTSLNRPTITVPVFSFEGDATFSDNELTRIQNIYLRVAEDFAPFDVNVTTQDPGRDALERTDTADQRFGMRATVGGDSQTVLGLSAGGIAYVGVFGQVGNARFQPAFNFNQGFDENNVAMTISHEVGHTLGLLHDGRTTPAEEYYGGHGSGALSWGPIMGAPFGTQITQWSNGDYPNGNRTQDDVTIIGTQNGFGFRPDEAGNTTAAAATLTVNSVSGVVNQSGVITTRSDVDVYRFTHRGGNFSLNANTVTVGPNLKIQIDLLNSSGGVVMSNTSATGMNASLSGNLAAGTYFVRIDGVGKAAVTGDPGFSDYGSIGSYTITGVVTTRSAPPVLSRISGAISYVAASPAILIDSDAVATDSDSTTLGGGSLTVRLTDGQPEDRIGIRSQGTGVGQVSVVGTNISFGGVLVGTWSGIESSAANPLVVQFNSAASLSAVQGVVRSITYRTTTSLPSTATRTVTFQLNDGSQNSNLTSKSILVQSAASANPVLGGLSDVTTFSPSTTIGWTGNSAILDNRTTEVVINSSAVATLSDVNVKFSLTHTYVGDLEISLVHPDGTVVSLMNRLGGSGQNITNTVFDQSAAESIVNVAAPFTGRYRPQGNLGVLNGKPVAGAWRLRVADRADGDVGAITNVSLEFGASSVPSVIVDNNATVTDSDSANFGGGALVATITNGVFSDELFVLNTGNAAGQVGVNGNNISFGGVLVGTTLTQRVNGQGSLVIRWNTAATPLAVQAVLRNIAYASTSPTASSVDRVIQFQVSDGDGGVSTPVNKILRMAPMLAPGGTGPAKSLLASPSRMPSVSFALQ